jgi:predicted O-methyltransferase YrrM
MNFATFASSPPRLHSWDGGKTWNTGGFGTYHLQRIFDFYRQNLLPDANIIETGAGCSTICFLHLEPARLVSIAPDKELFERIDTYCRENDVSTHPLQRYLDGSEWVLPELAKTARSDAGKPMAQLQSMGDQNFDLALIDGLHNWPTSMIDFFYINFMLKNGGFLMLDDVKLHSVAELYRFISYDTVNFRLRADLGKLQIFQKITDQRQLDEWHLHPYIEPMSWGADRPLHYYTKFVIRAKNLKNKLGF